MIVFVSRWVGGSSLVVIFTKIILILYILYPLFDRVEMAVICQVLSVMLSSTLNPPPSLSERGWNKSHIKTRTLFLLHVTRDIYYTPVESGRWFTNYLGVNYTYASFKCLFLFFMLYFL